MRSTYLWRLISGETVHRCRKGFANSRRAGRLTASAASLIRESWYSSLRSKPMVPRSAAAAARTNRTRAPNLRLRSLRRVSQNFHDRFDGNDRAALAGPIREFQRKESDIRPDVDDRGSRRDKFLQSIHGPRLDPCFVDRISHEERPAPPCLLHRREPLLQHIAFGP